MATVYSLVCFGGLSGKTVTFTDSGDVVSLTNHGLRQGVTGIVFSSTGSLPNGITAGVTYYPRDGADANKFTIYPTKSDALAGTNQVTFTGTGIGIHTVKSAYMLDLSPTKLARYGSSGSERIYSSLVPALSSMTSASPFDKYVVEIGEDFTDVIGSKVIINNSHLPGSIVITTTVDSATSSAFHHGNVSANSSGYIALISGYDCGISIERPYVTIEGIKVLGSGTSVFMGLSFESSAVCSKYSRCICMPGATQAYSSLGIFRGNANIIEHSIFYANGRTGATINGIIFYEYSGAGGGMYNCLVIGNNVNGVGMNTTSPPSNLWSSQNNIVIDFATNWGAASSGQHMNNVGEPGDAVWDTNSSSNNSFSTSWFNSYSSLDFRPSSSSPLIGGGDPKYSVSPVDILGDVRPNYNPSGEEEWDIGPFEYDHGNGLAPQQVTLSISGMAEGSVLAIYKTSDGSAIVNPTTIGASGSYSTTYSYTGDTQITVVVRKGTSGAKYLPYTAPGLITDTGFSLIVNQVVDGVLNG